MQVFIDVYPYETFGGGARPMIPKWSLLNKNVSIDGGRDDPKWGEKDLFKSSRKNLKRNWSNQKKREIPSRMSRIAFPKAKYGVYLAIIIIFIVLLILYRDFIF